MFTEPSRETPVPAPVQTIENTLLISLVGLILGVVSFSGCLSVACCGAIFTSIAGLVVSLIGYNNSVKENNAQAKTLSTIGLILSAFVLVMMTLIILAYIAFYVVLFAFAAASPGSSYP